MGTNSLAFDVREGDRPELDAVATGSHIDAIPYSGKYDGVVGVLGAIEAINVLKRFENYLIDIKLNKEPAFSFVYIFAFHTTIISNFLFMLWYWDIRRSGFKPKRSLEVILFTSEEPTRFGISCLGRLVLSIPQSNLLIRKIHCFKEMLVLLLYPTTVLSKFLSHWMFPILYLFNL